MIFGWLKRSMPRNLYGRALAILILPVVTLQLVISVSFVQRHFEGVTRQMTRSVLLELRHLVAQVEAAADPAAALAVAQALAAPLELTVALPATDRPDADSRRVYDLSGREVVATLRAGLPGLGPVVLPDDRAVRLWIATRHGDMSVGFDRRRVSASNPHQLIVLIVVLGGLMTLIAYLFLRNQLRPIKRMAHAAAEYGKGRIVPYSPSGAVEVRAAGAAFLDMRNRIERQAQARTMMLSGVSHDLRSPLTRMRLALSMIDEAEAAPLIRDVEEMQRLTDAFLDFARGDAGDDRAPVDLADLVGRIVADMRRASGKEVALTLPAAPLGMVSLRPLAIRRALENLLGNALRYGNRAAVTLHPGDRALRFVIEDDGPGIPADQRDEALRPFARLDPARNQDRGSGVGLGLAIVADIARSHGGSLRLTQSAALGGLKAELVIPV